MIAGRVLLFICGLSGLAGAGCHAEGEPLAPDSHRLPYGQQLTFAGDVFEAAPVFSPDGQWILFASDAAGNRDIWRLPSAGGAARQVTMNPAFDSAPTWAPDGRSFAFESDRGGRRHIWRWSVGSTGPGPQPLTTGNCDDGSPAWSPDGRHIVFESNRDKGRGTDLWVVSAQGGEPSRLTRSAPGVYHRSADWSPDGAQVVFESDREAGASALYAMKADGSGIRRITPLSGYEGHPAWSPDGAWIAFESRRQGAMEILLTAPAGGRIHVLTAMGGFWPDWSPGGTTLVYGRFGDDQANLWRRKVDLAGR